MKEYLKFLFVVLLSLTVSCSRDDDASGQRDIVTNLEKSALFNQQSTEESWASFAPLLSPFDVESTDIPTLARFWDPESNTNWTSVSSLCHILLFYGLGSTDIPAFPTGKSALRAITEEETAIEVFGESPFVRTRSGVRFHLDNDPVLNSSVGEAHRDQCLATFAALDLPLNTPMRVGGSSFSISDLLSEAVANFDLYQQEPAWTAMAFANYLPPSKEWEDRFGEKTTFSQLSKYLLELDPNTQSCAGTHIFQAIVRIDAADRKYSILDDVTRKQLDAYLTTVLRQTLQLQQADGGWTWKWCNSIDDDIETMRPLIETRLLVTGHLLETLYSLDSQRRSLAGETYVRAAEWLAQTLNSKEIVTEDLLLCPFTHAANAAKKLLAPSRK